MTAPDARPDVGGRTGPIMAALLVAGTTYAFTQTLVSPSLPALAARLDVTVPSAAWLLTAFLLASSVATPVVGKLGDLHDRGRVLVLVLVVFAAGSVLCAVSGVFWLTLLGRVVQGVAGGLFPLAYGIVNDLFPRKRVGPSIALLGTTFGVGSGLGLPLSGVLAGFGDPRLIFLTGLLALPAALAVHLLVPRRGPRDARPSLDLPGCGLFAVGLALLLLGISRSGSEGGLTPGVLALVVGGLVVLAGFVAVELRTEQPLVDVRVLRRRPVLATNAATLAIGVTLFTSFLLTPQFAQAPESAGYGFALGPSPAGALLLPSSLVMLLGGPLAGRLAARWGARLVLVIGALTGALATGLLALRHDTVREFLVAGAVMGLGTSFALAASATLVVELCDAADVGVATGINSVARTAGAALGSVLLASVLRASVAPGEVLPSEAGFTAAYALGSGAALLSAGLALLVPRGPRPARRSLRADVGTAGDAGAAGRPGPLTDLPCHVGDRR
ncbi:MAG: major facilitator superfamily 1 [Frankiales bacterium]|nr:major facilitator superfamily 1 [Frankiales bacterium]